MRLLILTEDYGDRELVMTDLNNKELESLLIKVEDNNEKGIGESLTEICEYMFPEAYMFEIGNTEESAYNELGYVNSIAVAYSDYLTFSVVRCEMEEN